MELRQKLMALLAPLALGDELLPGARLAGASVELGMRLRLDTATGPLWIDVTPLERSRHHAAASDRLAFGYRTDGGKRGVDARFALAACQRVAALARSNEARVLADVEIERRDEDGARIRHVDVDAMLEHQGRPGQTYFTLSPYVGCTIGCRFCYAASRVDPMRAVLGLPELPWGSYVEVRRNAPEVLAGELARLEPRPIKFCPIVSDPYQSAERRERVTRRCLEAVRDSGRAWPILLLTRSTLVLDDLALLGSIPRAFAGVSLPTIDDGVRRHFEPRAASIPERLEILRALRKAGVETLAVVQPMLEGPLEPLADALAGLVSSVSIDVLHGEIGAARDFDDPLFSHTREHAWQVTRARALAGLLGERGVPVWTSELPPELR